MENLASDKLEVLKKAFAEFDLGKTGYVECEKIVSILNTLDFKFNESEIEVAIKAIPTGHPGKANFENFCTIVINHTEEEEEDKAAMLEELKEAFRMYDREGNGYITTETLREILQELDNKLSDDDLDGIVDEIDEDGSGTVDFDEFMNMMTG